MEADPKKRNQTTIGLALGVAQGSVSLWVRGRSRPELPYRLALFELAGIPVEAWDSTEDARRLATARAGIRRLAAASAAGGR